MPVQSVLTLFLLLVVKSPPAHLLAERYSRSEAPQRQSHTVQRAESSPNRLQPMEVPYSHDLRAASTISRRARAREEKYYGFRYIKPGQLHQPHYRLLDPNNQPSTSQSCLFLSQSTHQNTTPIEYFTPRRLYEEAQKWPRPPTYHRRHKDKLDKRGAITAYETRKVARKDTGRTLREVSGPRETWEDDEPERKYRRLGAGCLICSHLPECMNKKYFDHQEAQEAETLASHRQAAAQSLLDEALKKRMSEQQRRLEDGGWIVLGCSDEDSGSEGLSDIEDGEWTVINS
ncbi:MAG: hypothetical protein LQ346_004860 [Caloplaca aetnensis]|nr:MAG: hypothetical protein LQ346_004860 [Caloplaca aetnensis]